MRRWLIPLLLLLAWPALAAERHRVAVLDIKADTEIAQGTLNSLNELMLTELEERGRLDALGSRDIANMLSLEEERAKLTGCVDETCMAEIGGALGVRLLVASSIGRIGNQFLVTVKVLDVKAARVLKRATETVDHDDAELIAAIKTAVRTVADAIKELSLDMPEPGESDSQEPREPVGFWDVAPWVGLGLTVALAGAGGTMGGLALKDKNALGDEVIGTADWKDVKDAGEQKGLAADVLFGVAGAAAVGTLLLFLLGPDEEPAASATLVPLEHGAAAAVQVRWH